MAGKSMAEDVAMQAASATQSPEAFIVVNGTLVHDGQQFPLGAEFHSDDAETIGALLACRAIARPEDALQPEQVAQTLDENAALKAHVQDLERQLAAAIAKIEKRERVI